MSAREWKPGDVALVTYRNDDMVQPETLRGIRWAHGWFVIDRRGHYEGVFDRSVRGVHPLAALDPEDREQVRAIADAAYPEGRANTNRLQAALREYANPAPPKPDEPQGLGAVVEDAGGTRWVRLPRPESACWANGHSFPQRYADLDAVRVLSEGVQP